jgi:hypothetical protein
MPDGAGSQGLLTNIIIPGGTVPPGTRGEGRGETMGERTKHIPGPYDYDEDMQAITTNGSYLASVASVDDFPCLDPEENDLVEVEDQYHASGRLLAAAPIGLELAEMVLKWDAHGKFIPPTIAAKAREFMDKATGK